MGNRPKPIFIIGSPRSGTTWLGGLLCRHSEIAGMEHERYAGLKESAFFDSFMPYFGDITSPVNYTIFIEAFTATDYFKLSGLPKNIFYKNWCLTYFDVFRLMMNEYAKHKGAAYWIEKTPGHLSFAPLLQSKFPDSKFILIGRDPHAVMASLLKIQPSRQQRHRQAFNVGFNIGLQSKALLFLKQHLNNYLTITFSDLKNQTEKTMQSICNYLELCFEKKTTVSKYVKNSSFQTSNIQNRAMRHVPKPALAGFFCGKLVPSNIAIQILKYRKETRPQIPTDHHWGLHFEKYSIPKQNPKTDWGGKPLL